MLEIEAYISIKDHKEDFPKKISFHLINPSKSSIGKISKVVLDKINNIVQSKSSVNQWNNTAPVIGSSISKRRKVHLSLFLILKAFYPSISEDLLKSAIQFAKESIVISDYDFSLINQARKTLLFHENTSWVNKEDNEDFHVPMDCFDGTEVCELVDTYILNQLKNVFPHHSIGLYRDDGLAVVKGLSNPEIERMKMRVIKFFKDGGLKITIIGSLKIVNFLDGTFNLHKNTYENLKINLPTSM